jgi:hypothetical protein
MTDPNEQSLELQRALGRVEGSLDGLHGKFDSLSTQHAEIIKRVAHVEKKQNYIIGWAAGGAAIAGGILSLLEHLHKIAQ